MCIQVSINYTNITKNSSYFIYYEFSYVVLIDLHNKWTKYKLLVLGKELWYAQWVMEWLSQGYVHYNTITLCSIDFEDS